MPYLTRSPLLVTSANFDCGLWMEESEHFGVQRWGIYFFGEHSGIAEIDVRGVPNVSAFVERYE